MATFPRVAFLPDTFHEINGVAHTSRQLEAFARRRELPLLSVHCGPALEITHDGPVTVMQLKRGPASFGLDAHLDCDPFLLRYKDAVVDQLREFDAQLVHITGPGDMGVLGCYVAWKLSLPMVISWHTSLHEYAGRRLERTLRILGEQASNGAGQLAEKWSREILTWFYRRARVILAPNDELVNELRLLTNRPVFLMRRGVDTELFNPLRRARTDSKFRLGYVGRLTPEKDVRFLAELGHALIALGRNNFEFVLVGQGSETEWLRDNVPNVVLPGVLRGEQLAQAYANMDAFIFPSKTDTFGNVVLEALSSGVPAAVTNEGGPKFLIEHGRTGYVAATSWEFTTAVNALMTDSALHRKMCQAARQYACAQSWDSVFETVFDAYRVCLEESDGDHHEEDALLSSRLHERRGA